MVAQPLIPTLRGQRQTDLYGFTASFGYISGSRIARDTQLRPCIKKRKTKLNYENDNFKTQVVSSVKNINKTRRKSATKTLPFNSHIPFSELKSKKISEVTFSNVYLYHGFIFLSFPHQNNHVQNKKKSNKKHEMFSFGLRDKGT